MKILVIDDEKNIRDSIAKYLSTEAMEAVTANNGFSGKKALEENVFDACILDLKMPGMDGLEFLRWLKEEGPVLPVIMISAYQDLKDAVEAMKLGAKDYIVKPFEPEELIIRLKRVISENEALKKVESGKLNTLEKNDFIGDSKKISEIKSFIQKIAKTKSNVLITGESGTGKEVAARLIHNLSVIRDKPFIPVNMGGIPENLLESELFGYEKGAFTGAELKKIGIFELAKDGTLFLDEIGDISLSLQVKLLRAIQDKKIQRLGSIQPIPIESRIISATNKDLEKMIKENTFREDLFFRLNIVRIELPSLRDHKDDIPALTGYFIKKFNKIMDKKINSISPEALNKLMSYNFPGNIRELENIIERAFIFCDSNELKSFDIDIRITRKQSVKIGTLQENEKQTIIEALHRWNWNRTRASKELGITRRTLITKIKEYGIKE